MSVQMLKPPVGYLGLNYEPVGAMKKVISLYTYFNMSLPVKIIYKCHIIILCVEGEIGISYLRHRRKFESCFFKFDVWIVSNINF